MEGLDKILNRDNGFRYPHPERFDAARHVRLLAIQNGELETPACYKFKKVALEELHKIKYKALSYVWGHATSPREVGVIRVNKQRFFVRRNLYDFFSTMRSKGESDLFFIDAICINQLDDRERQAQVAAMSQIYFHACEVIAWLGTISASQSENVRQLHAGLDTFKAHDSLTMFTTPQWEAYRYLSQHEFWSRLWILQEICLASRVTLWCGVFELPLQLFGKEYHRLQAPKTRINANGRPTLVITAESRLRSSAENVVTHRKRLFVKRIEDRTQELQDGDNVWTADDMNDRIQTADTVARSYQSQTPDLLHTVVRKFGKMDCADPRDKLYGIVGILNSRSREKIQVDYTRGPDFAYYQALKIGLRELHHEHGMVEYSYSREHGDAYLGYYCDLRDGFGMDESQSITILRQVLQELGLRRSLDDAICDVQWQQQFSWRDTTIDVTQNVHQLITHAEKKEHAEDWQDHELSRNIGGSTLLRFHTLQHRMARRLCDKVKQHFIEEQRVEAPSAPDSKSARRDCG